MGSTLRIKEGYTKECTLEELGQGQSSGEKGAIPGRGGHTCKVLEAGKGKKLRAGGQPEGERWEMKLERWTGVRSGGLYVSTKLI